MNNITNCRVDFLLDLLMMINSMLLNQPRNLAFRVLLLFVFVCPTSLAAQTIDIEQPGEREFIVDLADVISADDETSIQQRADQLLTDTAIPIIVVTVERMTDHNRFGDMRVETFSHLLFDQWGIGHAEIDGNVYNTGMLLVVSEGDRRARIQLGDAWGRTYDNAAKRIMDRIIIPEFKRGDYSAGIRKGVEALEELARSVIDDSSNVQQPAPPIDGVTENASDNNAISQPPTTQRPPFELPAGAPTPGGGGVLGGGTLNSNQLCSLAGCGPILIIVLIIGAKILGSAMYRGGRGSGVGHTFDNGMWGGLLGGLLGGMSGGHHGGGFGSRGSSGGSISSGGFGGRKSSGSRGSFGGFSSGGGFSGGSFGGGFSGGGGASGSW